MKTDESEFITQLRANPTDVTTRLVYADWLDDFTDRHEDAAELRKKLAEWQVQVFICDPLRVTADAAVSSWDIKPVPHILRTILLISFPVDKASVLPELFLQATGEMQIVIFGKGNAILADITQPNLTRLETSAICWLPDSGPMDIRACSLRECSLNISYGRALYPSLP